MYKRQGEVGRHAREALFHFPFELLELLERRRVVRHVLGVRVAVRRVRLRAKIDR